MMEAVRNPMRAYQTKRMGPIFSLLVLLVVSVSAHAASSFDEHMNALVRLSSDISNLGDRSLNPPRWDKKATEYSREFSAEFDSMVNGEPTYRNIRLKIIRIRDKVLDAAFVDNNYPHTVAFGLNDDSYSALAEMDVGQIVQADIRFNPTGHYVGGRASNQGTFTKIENDNSFAAWRSSDSRHEKKKYAEKEPQGFFIFMRV